MSVRWTSARGDSERIVMQSEYLSNGCRIPVGTGAVTFLLSAILRSHDGVWLSPQRYIEVPAAPAAVHWDIQFRRNIFCTPVSATLQFSGTDVDEVDVVVVGAYGRVMPYDDNQGILLTRARVRPAANTELQVPLPRGKRLQWVRAFLKSPGAGLVDPSPSKMKVE
jgi:hypothetical protein